MTNSKPFKTLNQQLKILRDRGLNVPSNAKRSLEQNGYYAIINGYKWSFLQRDSKGTVISPEQFVNGANFSEIQSLYDFDRELRSILFESLLKYENTLNATVSYRFSEAHPEEHSYLAIDNFTRDPQKVQSVVRTISSLSNVVKNKSGQDNAIKHYVNKHRHVPLWVLVNFLTFGDINFFHQIMTNDLRITVAKDFTHFQRRSYPGQFIAGIQPEAIDSVNQLVNHFRNAVAHGEITFSKKIFKTPNLRPFKAALGNPNIPLNSQAGVFEILIGLKVVLPKKDFKKLAHRIDELIRDYQNDFKSITFNSVLNDMNFPQNYKDFIL
ncbi:Abi family protein [Weissella confusa]|uniref:Abi family protein n=1 Tax=Weissella confusa TaxID=1583 RepID=A0A4Z0RIY0_WEICO|nr:Abi family protein [Weissella confusa]COJ50300.1 Abi family protein [Streptococcus pneumoniae]MBJ7633489.1 Abi family protein [Weissella confusa]MBJ7638510.1 Abi family protein [Weissella confusa]MBJ7646292.1 Abi family protein [Weissella confusa]TGE52916.1 DNA-binding protein [Weissella confusa]